MNRIRQRARRAICTVAALVALGCLAARAEDVGQPNQVAAAKAVLEAYNTATQKLDVTGTSPLFTEDSEIIESGGVEGTFAHYLKNHIGPELQEFKSFTFSNYSVQVTIAEPFAFATESFQFRIEPKAGDTVERLAVATSVLRHTSADWKIYRYHWSTRRIAPPAAIKP